MTIDNVVDYVTALESRFPLLRELAQEGEPNQYHERVVEHFYKIVDLYSYLLKPKQLQALKLIYNPKTHRRANNDEIGAVMNLTRERIRQLHAKAFRIMDRAFYKYKKETLLLKQ